MRTPLAMLIGSTELPGGGGLGFSTRERLVLCLLGWRQG